MQICNYGSELVRMAYICTLSWHHIKPNRDDTSLQSLLVFVPLCSLNSNPTPHRGHRGEENRFKLRRPGGQETKLKCVARPSLSLSFSLPLHLVAECGPWSNAVAARGRHLPTPNPVLLSLPSRVGRFIGGHSAVNKKRNKERSLRPEIEYWRN